MDKSESFTSRPDSDVRSTCHIARKKTILPPLLTDLFKPSLDSKAYRPTHQIMTASNAFHFHQNLSDMHAQAVINDRLQYKAYVDDQNHFAIFNRTAGGLSQRASDAKTRRSPKSHASKIPGTSRNVLKCKALFLQNRSELKAKIEMKRTLSPARKAVR